MDQLKKAIIHKSTKFKSNSNFSISNSTKEQRDKIYKFALGSHSGFNLELQAELDGAQNGFTYDQNIKKIIERLTIIVEGARIARKS